MQGVVPFPSQEVTFDSVRLPLFRTRTKDTLSLRILPLWRNWSVVQPSDHHLSPRITSFLESGSHPKTTKIIRKKLNQLLLPCFRTTLSHFRSSMRISPSSLSQQTLPPTRSSANRWAWERRRWGRRRGYLRSGRGLGKRWREGIGQRGRSTTTRQKTCCSFFGRWSRTT